jgi:hypothetical protein
MGRIGRVFTASAAVSAPPLLHFKLQLSVHSTSGDVVRGWSCPTFHWPSAPPEADLEEADAFPAGSWSDIRFLWQSGLWLGLILTIQAAT